MKTFRQLLLLLCLIFMKGYEAQVFPIDTYLGNIPAGAYLKDSNNDLNKFVGIYQTNYKGNTIAITLTKAFDIRRSRMRYDYFTDGLLMGFSIKSPNGQVLQISTVNHLNKINYIDFDSTKQMVAFHYSGTHCRNGNGIIYLKYKNPQQLGWVLKDGTDGSSNCPPGADTTVYLPEWDEVIFTRQ